MKRTGTRKTAQELALRACIVVAYADDGSRIAATAIYHGMTADAVSELDLSCTLR